MSRAWFTVLGVTLGLLLVLVLMLLPAPPPPMPKDLIAALPGVGYGWIDTLQRVVGPVTLDTVSDLENYEEGNRDLIGLYEPMHNLISVRVKMISYARYASHWNHDICQSFDYTHPIEITGIPAGTLAHEFGHLFQFRAQPHEIPQPGDSLPPWARDNIIERYADRFARAMLAIRGWADPSPYPDDQRLLHHLRYLLIKSYWPTVVNSLPDVNEKASPDGTTVTHP